MIVATMTLTMDERGRVVATGPLHNQSACYAMLQMAMDIVRAHNPAPTPESPGNGIRAQDGADAVNGEDGADGESIVIEIPGA